MKNLDFIAEELFNKIRGRFPSVTIGNEKGEVTNVPNEARYYDFEFKEGQIVLGKVSVSLDEKGVAVMYSNDFVTNEDSVTKENWYGFLKELRTFAKKRLLNFDTRDITKSNLDRRDYQFLAKNRPGEVTMESKMYGTSKTSYQNLGSARLAIKHTAPINQESVTGRIRNVGSIYIESADGERFKYPFKHLNGARAMAMHVSEGGKPYDDFGTHIVSLSEELSKLKKFKTYMGRSAVMAEGLVGYVDVVNERIQTVKKTLNNLQKESFYKEAVSQYSAPVMEEVPADVAENWIDELTIKQFNEELQDIFPYIYNLVKEGTKAKELGPEDLLDNKTFRPVDDVKVDKPAESYKVQSGDTMYSIYKKFADANFQGSSFDEAVKEILALNPDITDPAMIQPGMTIQMPYFMGAGPDGASRGLPPSGFKKYESELESAFEEMLGQFAEGGVTLTQPGEEPAADAHTMDKQVAMNKDMSQQAAGGKDLGDGFELVDTEVAGQKVKGVRDNQSGSTIVINKSIIRSPAKYIVIDKGGKMTPQMKLGPQTSQAMQKAGLGETLTPSDDEWSKQLQIPNRETWEKLIKQAKAKGDKKMLSKLMAMGDQFASKDQKTPLGEFILSYFDRNTGQFPKGETAILTMVEKDYGEKYITPAKQFIEKINHRVSEVMGQDVDESGLQYYTGKKKYGKDGMAALAKAGRDGASEEELGAIKDKYKKESEDLLRLAGL